MDPHKIRVLVVEDSAVIRLFLVHLLESDPQICVIAAVNDGLAAVDFVKRDKPDVVLMDVHMPHLDGFEATRCIMESNPVPIVICSSTLDTRDIAIAFQALEMGAIACIEKPLGKEHPDFPAQSRHLLETVKLMSEVRVVRRRARMPTRPLSEARLAGFDPSSAAVRLIGIGASTGGPQVLQTIFASLPRDFPIPILVVQHITPGFLRGMATWLNDTTGMPVHIATHGLMPQPGHIYLAPDECHMGISAYGEILLSDTPKEHHLRPAVSFLFRSLTKVLGPHTLGVLLTGMGRDGADELKAMKDSGAVTIAQDRESSVVHGMPGAAIALKGATYVLPPDKITEALVEQVKPKNGIVTN
jgi:two-component system chemotaxis response regulator CheB